jgi:hypothetical protein
MTRAHASAALLLALLAGCGWHAGIEAPPGARSIGIEAVRRNEHVLERGLEPLLTEQLSRSVSDWVALPLASPSQADLVVRGEILDYRRRSGVRNTQNELIETAVFIRAQAELFDRTSGRTSAPVFAQAWSGFALDDPAQEEAARDRALRVIAETLVLDLFQDGPLPAEPVPQ